MKKPLLGSILVVGLLMGAGLVPALALDISAIQNYDPATGAPDSPYDGEEVAVTGTIYVIAGTYNFGTWYIQDDTGGIQVWGPEFNGNPLFEIGAVVEVTGVVSAFGGEIQITNTDEVPVTMEWVGTAPEPTPLELAAIQVPRQWQNVGLFVAITGTVRNVQDDGGSDWFSFDAGEDSVLIFVDGDTGIDISGIVPGIVVRVLGSCNNFYSSSEETYNIQCKPRMQADILGPPAFSDFDSDNWAPEADDAVTMSVTITDDEGIVAATFYYRDSDGESTDAFLSVSMTDLGGDRYSATIPAPHTMSQIDYYFEATDTDDQTATSPGGAPDFYRAIAVGLTSIYDMQMSDPPDFVSPYDGKVLNIQGVVTVGTIDFASGLSRFVIQEQVAGPDGSNRWGGMYVYEGSDTLFLFRGDVVRIGGYGDEYFGMTQIRPFRENAVYLVDFTDQLPLPIKENTAVLADPVLGEPYESVWVNTYPSQVVIGEDQFGEFVISDTGALADSLVVDPTVDLNYVPTVGDMVRVEGYMDYNYSVRHIRPISDDYVDLLDVSAVGDMPTVLPAGGFVSVAPNPFNPTTKITFVVNRAGPVQLNIYNIRGEMVRSLINGNLAADEYVLSWDARDSGGQSLASGQYFARLRIGAELMQVRKLSLVK